jgi:hypothetical protein
MKEADRAMGAAAAPTLTGRAITKRPAAGEATHVVKAAKITKNPGGANTAKNCPDCDRPIKGNHSFKKTEQGSRERVCNTPRAASPALGAQLVIVDTAPTTDSAVQLASPAGIEGIKEKMAMLKHLHDDGYLTTELYNARQMALLVAHGL